MLCTLYHKTEAFATAKGSKRFLCPLAFRRIYCNEVENDRRILPPPARINKEIPPVRGHKYESEKRKLYTA